MISEKIAEVLGEVEQLTGADMWGTQNDDVKDFNARKANRHMKAELERRQQVWKAALEKAIEQRNIYHKFYVSEVFGAEGSEKRKMREERCNNEILELIKEIGK